MKEKPKYYQPEAKWEFSAKPEFGTSLIWERSNINPGWVLGLRSAVAIGILLLVYSGVVPLAFQFPAALVAWFAAGGEIIIDAVAGLWHGRFFDEKFLVTLTTVGAFALGANAEAALVMLFFMLGEILELRAVNHSRMEILALPDVFTPPMEIIKDKAPAEKMITRFARIYTPTVIIAAVAISTLPPLFSSAEWSTWGYRGLIFLVASCPCSLVLAIPLTFYTGLTVASRKGILFKGSNYLSALAQTETIIFDQQGLLTQGEYRIKELIPAEGTDESALIKAAAIALSRSTEGYAKNVLARFGSVPEAHIGDSSVETSGQGIQVNHGGTLYYCGNGDFLAFSGISLPLTMASMLKNPAAIFVAKDNHFLGCLVLERSLREDAVGVMEDIRRMGIPRTILLSSDSQEAAGTLAAILGIGEVHANLPQENKGNIVAELLLHRSEHKTITYVGSEGKEVPALAKADIGLAIGTNVSKQIIQVSEVLITTDSLVKLPAAIALSRRTLAIARQNIALVLLINALILFSGFFGYASIWGALTADIAGTLIAIFNASRLAFSKNR